jgi:hypothetical protein
MKTKYILPASLLSLISVGIIFLFSDFSTQKISAEKNYSTSTLKSGETISVTDTFLLPDSLAKMETLLIAHKSEYRMNLYTKGKLLKTYTIALGQEPLGPKQKQGDNKTPEGMYKIIQKSRGPFEGDYSQYLGVAWMRLNYPNNADAVNGFKKGLITEAQKNSIINANNAGKEPPKTTKLGGGIGIHGWWGDWPGTDKQNLTWGCISLQNKDLDDLYGRIQLGTVILILP